jgi:hypothetical protein
MAEYSIATKRVPGKTAEVQKGTPKEKVAAALEEGCLYL